MKDQDGADELAKRALEEGIKPDGFLKMHLFRLWPGLAISSAGRKFMCLRC